jgi:hypothetical protein
MKRFESENDLIHAVLSLAAESHVPASMAVATFVQFDSFTIDFTASGLCAWHLRQYATFNSPVITARPGRGFTLDPFCSQE